MTRLTPRKAIFDALQRCPSGLTLHGLAHVAYRGTSERDRRAAYRTIVTLRQVARIEADDGRGRLRVFRLLGVF